MKNTSLKEWCSSSTTILPIRDIMILFLKRSLYASWTQNFLHHPPDACPTSDTSRVAAINGSPSNVHLVLDFLGHHFRSRDVVTIFVCRSLRWFLLGTARMLLVTSEVDVCRKLLQHVRELLCIHAAEDAPVRTGDGDHHPVIGLRYL